VKSRRLAGVLILVALATFGRGLSTWLESDDFDLVAWGRFEGGGGPARWFSTEWGRAWSYRPLVLAAAGLLSEGFGTNGLPYHLLSLALHTASGLVLLTLFRSPARPPALALAGPLFFLVHPRAQESVYWFAAVGYPLAAFCGLASLSLAGRAAAASTRARRLALAASSCGAFAAGLLSHPVALAFTPAFVAVARGPIPDPRGGERVALVLPHVLAAAAAIGLTLRLDSPNAFAHVAPSLADALRGALLLVGSTTLPFPLGPVSFSVLQVVGLATLLALAAIAAARRDRWAWAGLLVTAAAALLTASAYPSVIDDRYHYVPALGLALCVSSLAQGEEPRTWLRAARVLGFGVCAAVAAVGIAWNSGKASSWIEAGRTASVASRSLVEAVRARPARWLALFGVPDNVRGAYVFRTGLGGRLALEGIEVAAEVLPLGRALVDERRLAGRAVYLWLGETEGWLDLSLERRGPELRVFSPQSAPGGGLTEATVELAVVPGAYCVDLFAAAPARAAPPRLRVSLDGATVADLLVTEDLERYPVPVSIERAASTLEIHLAPPEVGRGVVVPAVVVRRRPERGHACGAMR
jgi:hypothetical protein